jgi:hypothetical protein
MPPDDAQPRIGQINAHSALTAGNFTNNGVINMGGAPPRTSSHSHDCTPPRKLPARIDEFVGRLQAISTIHASLTAPRQPGVKRSYVIHGHGGIGKTSLATAYAWTYLAAYPGGSFFVDCSIDDFSSTIADLYPYLFGVHDADTTHQATKAVRVKHQLEVSDKQSLLILDNIRDPEHHTKLRNCGFLPLGSCDHLITTTNPHLPNAGPSALEGLCPEDGLALLAAHRPDIVSAEDSHAAAVIVHWLGGIPFCLAVVGIYMRRNPIVTWQQYAHSLESMGLDALRDAEATAGMLSDSYAHRIEPIMDTLLSSLNPNERRALEYMALFPREIAESVLMNLLTVDSTLTLPLKPGYPDPVRYILTVLEYEHLIIPHGDGYARTLTIHELLRRKIMERLSSEQNMRTQLLKNIYDCSVESFIAPTDFTTVDDPYQAFQHAVQFNNSMLMSFQVLENHGYIDNAGGHYNYWLDFGGKMNNARKLAAELKCRVDMRMDFSVTGHHMTPIVVVEEPDRSKAEALARQYGGQIKFIGSNPSDVKCAVVINIAA